MANATKSRLMAAASFLGIGAGLKAPDAPVVDPAATAPVLTPVAGDPPEPTPPSDDNKPAPMDPKDADNRREHMKGKIQQALSDDDALDMTGDDEVAQAAWLKSQARVARIMGHAAAGKCPNYALHLALNTTRSSAEVITDLESAPEEAKQGGLGAAMAPHAGRDPGADAPAGQQKAEAGNKQWDAHVAAVRGTRKGA